MSPQAAYAFLSQQLQTNQFLTGATITGALMGVVYAVKGWALSGYRMVKDFFRVSLTIHSEDALYLPITTWLYENRFDRLSRKYRIRYVDGLATYGPAEGSFLFLHTGKLIHVSITREQTQQGASWRAQTREFLTIAYYSFSRSKDIINDIVKRAIEESQRDDRGVPVYGNGSCYTRIPRRAEASVVLAGRMLEDLEADVATFLARKEWYASRGVPYHRGYLLTGPPGTGKTSVVRHLAQRFGLPVYVCNGTISSIHATPPKSILLIEDVDGIQTRRLEAIARGGGSHVSSTPSEDSSSISGDADVFAPSLSELLNALDGVASTDEVIVLMTTNHPERIDPAVIRPGRVDYQLYLGPCTTEQATRMFTKFFGEELAPLFMETFEDGSLTPAQLQELFIRVDDPRAVIETLAQAEVAAA